MIKCALCGLDAWAEKGKVIFLFYGTSFCQVSKGFPLDVHSVLF